MEKINPLIEFISVIIKETTYLEQNIQNNTWTGSFEEINQIINKLGNIDNKGVSRLSLDDKGLIEKYADQLFNYKIYINLRNKDIGKQKHFFKLYIMINLA